MNASPLLAALLVVLVSVAGCVSSESAKSTSATSDATIAGPATVSDNTGAIQGVVTDDAAVPVEGADVGVTELQKTTKTDASGAFTISGLAPGTYTVAYQKLGYDSAAHKVTVTAGQITPANQQLVALAVIVGYPEVQRQDGYIQCSVRAYPGAPLTGAEPSGWYSSVNVCGLFCIVQCLPVFSADRFGLTFKLKDTHTQEVMIEMVWSSTQAAGSALSVALEDPPNFNTKDGTYVNARGQSPVRGSANETWMQHVANFTKADCTETKCTMNTRVFADAKLTGLEMPVNPPDVPVFGPPPKQIDAGVTLDQKFTQYVSAFHYMDIPEKYTALADQ